MAIVRPFCALRPVREAAARVAAVPYDVVDRDEARALGSADALSFLHVSRAEIDLPASVDPHADEVYQQAAARYQELKREAPFVRDTPAALYVYRLSTAGHEQVGVGACYSLDDYDRGVIKKHERTRRDKEDDRTRHIVELHAQTGPVFLIYKPIDRVHAVMARTAAGPPLIDFEAVDGVRHTIWMVGEADTPAVIDAFAGVTSLYIADGHHRAASAARARASAGVSSEGGVFLAVAFPSDQVRILPYNRTVKDLNGRTPEAFLGALAREGLAPKPGVASPVQKGDVSMYVNGTWYVLDIKRATNVQGAGAGELLDGNVLHERVLEPILGIGDIRTDARIAFVGGARGTDALARAVDSGAAAAAFSMYPVSVQELMAVSDAGSIMPPKSTWFEPKLRDGLLIHEI
jgi:uncharacterized protein (DUF1015 family)